MKKPTFRTELDPIGQYYASVITPDHPGQFMLSAYLKETVNPEVLQRTVNDLMHRLPFLYGRLEPKFFWYHHKLLSTPPQIVWMGDTYTFTDYYNKGEGHVLRVLYGERHITLEAIHSVVDGRGLTVVMQTLLGRYFERLGVIFEKGDMIDCSVAFQPEEWEDAYARFYDPTKGKSNRKGKKHPKAYHHEARTPMSPYVILKTFDLTKVKQRAKAQNATISEYMMAQIFAAIAEERNARGCNKPIIALVPIDCRSFFPTKTLRSFVDSVMVTMPETDNFAEMVRGIRAQFAKIDAAFVQANINEFQGFKNSGRFLPRGVKKWILRQLEHSEEGGMTTSFSNIGKVSLLPEIEARIAHMAFIIDAAKNMPISFASATVGNTLTLAFTLCMEADALVQSVVTKMEGTQ